MSHINVIVKNLVRTTKNVKKDTMKCGFHLWKRPHKRVILGGVNMTLMQGQRYEWYINNVEDKKKDGLFTGEYAKNGNAILLTRNGETWSIPVKNLTIKSKQKGR